MRDERPNTVPMEMSNLPAELVIPVAVSGGGMVIVVTRKTVLLASSRLV